MTVHAIPAGARARRPHDPYAPSLEYEFEEVELGRHTYRGWAEVSFWGFDDWQVESVKIERAYDSDGEIAEVSPNETMLRSAITRQCASGIADAVSDEMNDRAEDARMQSRYGSAWRA